MSGYKTLLHNKEEEEEEENNESHVPRKGRRILNPQKGSRKFHSQICDVGDREKSRQVGTRHGITKRFVTDFFEHSRTAEKQTDKRGKDSECG